MDELIIKKLSFTKRPLPISAEYRPIYRISLILLILKVNCVKESASLLKLHLFSWALKSIDNLKKLHEYVKSDFTSDLKIFSIEPSLNRALSFAIAEGLISLTEGKYVLANKGSLFVQKIIADKELFKDEKYYLSQIAKKISETQIDKLKQNWQK